MITQINHIDGVKIASLNLEFERFCAEELRRWRSLSRGNLPIIGAWSGNAWFDRIEAQFKRFIGYLTPLAIAWWAERGYCAEFGKNGSAAILEKISHAESCHA